MRMDTSILEDIGLTNAEIKVYLALLELGESKAGQVIKKTRLQNSVVHMTLHKLVDKSLISFIKKVDGKHYQATNPQNIIKFIEEKKKRFQTILPELLSKQKKQEKQEAEIYEGFKGLKNASYEAIKNAKKKDEWLFLAFYTENPDDFENVYNFYHEFEKERKKLGIVVRGIAPIKIKDKFKTRDQKTLLFVDFPIPTNINLFQDTVMLTPWEDKQITIVVHSKQLAESFRQYFYSIWNQYKK